MSSGRLRALKVGALWRETLVQRLVLRHAGAGIIGS